MFYTQDLWCILYYMCHWPSGYIFIVSIFFIAVICYIKNAYYENVIYFNDDLYLVGPPLALICTEEVGHG